MATPRAIVVPAITAAAALAALAGWNGPAQSFRVQSAEDAARLLARLAFLEDRCATDAGGNRPGLTELVRSGGTGPLLEAELAALERMASQDGLGAACAALAETPGLGRKAAAPRPQHATSQAETHATPTADPPPVADR